MDYEKAYKEALKRAKILYNDKNEIGYANAQSVLEEVFPLLKESDDERIRKALIEYFNEQCDMSDWNGVYGYQVVAWLEKQATPQMVEDAFLKGCNDTKKSLLKKQGEQKPADKVEPKFKVGDWVVQGYNILKIKCVGDTHYCFETVGGYVDDMLVSEIDSQFHLWTIQDAKDGDVLSDGTTIFIFKDLLSDGSVMSYCDYDTDSGESDAFCPLSVNLMCSKITPSTKEQRDTLMKAMTDAGCTFDFKKKELKKKQLLLSDVFDLELELEKTKEMNSTKWSEEDDYNLQCCIAKAFYDIQNGNVGKNNELIDWLKSLKNRVQPKQEWSEEDEHRIELLKALCEDKFLESAPNSTMYEEMKITIGWLKSLKDRTQPQWKPSKEQMQVLVWCKPLFVDPKSKEILDSLINDLKKLL